MKRSRPVQSMSSSSGEIKPLRADTIRDGLGPDDSWLRMGYAKIVEERENAARYSLALEARRARNKNRQTTSGSLLSRLRSMVDRVFGHGGPAMKGRFSE